MPTMRITLTLWLCAGALACVGGASQPGEPFDVVILGGRIVDGAGNPWYYGDIAVRGERIAKITRAGGLADAPSDERIDARGLIVSPGFIDIQSHSERKFLRGDGRVVGSVTQGITTAILGEGWTPAPLNAEMLEHMLADAGEEVDSAFRRMARNFIGPDGFAAWLNAMQENGISPNVGSFVGATTIRVYGKGREMGPASPAQIDSMQKAVRWAMEDGAFGIASALIYPPGSFASTEELIAINQAAAPYGGLYITHMRSEADSVLAAIGEAIRIGVQAGVPVEIYHLKVAGRRNWEKQVRMVAKIDSAREAAIDVQANMYPYTAGSTGLAACLPPWVSAGGQLYENLADPVTRARVKAEILSEEPGDWENLCALATPEGVLLLGFEKPENQKWMGMRLSEVADATGKHWVDAIIDLLLSERNRISAIYFLMSDENVRTLLQQPWMKYATDAAGFDPDSATEMTHPRAYGTYPRILGRYVREQDVLRLEDAIRKMTSAVAMRLQLENRGMIQEGMYADIVVFDPEIIRDYATYQEPHQLSIGIRFVLINGVPVIRDGEHTGAMPGRILRGPGYNEPEGLPGLVAASGKVVGG